MKRGRETTISCVKLPNAMLLRFMAPKRKWYPYRHLVKKPTETHYCCCEQLLSKSLKQSWAQRLCTADSLIMFPQPLLDANFTPNVSWTRLDTFSFALMEKVQIFYRTVPNLTTWCLRCIKRMTLVLKNCGDGLQEWWTHVQTSATAFGKLWLLLSQ